MAQLQPRPPTQSPTSNGTPAKRRMTLASITKSTTNMPFRIVLWGVEGIGKSTFASQAEKPIFLGPEDGTPHLSVDRFPVPDSMTFQDIMDAIDELIQNDTPFKTLVLDTVDWIESLVWDAVCRRTKSTSIEEVGGGFQKGYKEAITEWRMLLSRLEVLRNRRHMNILLLGHHKTATFKNPEGQDYIRFVMKIDAIAAGLLKEWCDAVFFANYETVAKGDKKRPAKGLSTGNRLIHTQWCAAWDAKTRYALPEVMSLDWSEFQEALKAGHVMSAVDYRSAISAMAAEASEELRGKVEASVAAAGDDTAKLAQISNRLSAALAREQQ